MKRLLKISVCSLLCLVLLLACTAAFAASPVDTEAKGTICLSFAPDGMPAESASFALYKVASLDASCVFAVESKFASLAGLADELSEHEPNYTALAASLVNSGLLDSAVPAASTITDVNGEAVFSDLGVGLYLVCGDVYETDGKCYVPAAFLLSVPIIPGRDANPVDETWVYEYDASVKSCESFDRISVQKLWSDAESNDHADDSVTVTLYADGEPIDEVVLSKENNWRFTWDRSSVPVELLRSTKSWAVKETEGLEGYTASVTQEGSVFTVTNTKDPEPEPEPVLPQTGLLWWPVPVLLAAGIALLLVAYAARTKGKEHD